MRLVLIGPPASGKGTQGQRLAQLRGWSYLSTGSLLRSQVREQTPEGVLADSFLQKGQYVPDELIFPMVDRWLQQHPDQWILDGFPRTLKQAEGFAGLLEKRNSPLAAAILLDVDFETLLQRMISRVECDRCGKTSNESNNPIGSQCVACDGSFRERADDEVENFKSRYQQFQKHTSPVIDFYERNGLLKRIDARGSADDVFFQVNALF